MPVIANVVAWFAAALDGITQFVYEVSIRSISELNSSGSRYRPVISGVLPFF